MIEDIGEHDEPQALSIAFQNMIGELDNSRDRYRVVSSVKRVILAY